MNDTVNNAAYAVNNGGNVIPAIITSAFTSYITQVFPTLFGQVEAATNENRETTYTDKNSKIPKDTQYLLGKLLNKVPGVDYNQTEYIDAWGRKENQGSAVERAFNNLLNPSYVSDVDTGKVEQELQRIADATGDTSILPQRAENKITYSSKDASGNSESHELNLSAEQYQTYAQALGQGRYKMLKEAVGSDFYKSMSDSEKSGYLAKLYQYTNQQAKSKVAPDAECDPWMKNAQTAKSDLGVSSAAWIALYQKYGSSVMSGESYEKVKAAHQSGLPVEDYVSLKSGMDSNGNGSVTQDEAKAALDNAGLSPGQKADLWTIIDKSWKKNPYR